MRMIKRLVSFVLVLLCCTVMVGTASAAGEKAMSAADELYELGLFQGKGTNADGSPRYALDDVPTRHEAITMLVRLLGKETEATVGSWKTPFTDVASWAEPYVGYAYANGLTQGMSDTTFGGNNTVSAAQYITFVLRALGYEDGKDFSWKNAWELTDKLGITNGEYSGESAGKFLREDVVLISRAALDAKVQPEGITLREKILAGREEGNKFVFRVDPVGEGVDSHWTFDIRLYNTTNSVMTLNRLRILKCVDGSEKNISEKAVFEKDRLSDIRLGTNNEPLTLKPGESFSWKDSHPIVDWFDYMVYEFRFLDQTGEEVTYVYAYHLSHGAQGKAHTSYADETEKATRDPVKPVEIGSQYAWRFNFIIENTTDSPITIRQLTIAKRAGGRTGTLLEEFQWGAQDLPSLQLGDENGPLRLEPGERFLWNDGHPVTDYFDFMGYTFTFEDASGKKIESVHSLPLSHELPEKVYPSFGNDQGRDLKTLRYDADYCVESYDGVYWVPARALGESDFTNAEIQAMLTGTPEEKQAKIDTLYEALQLYQVGYFHEGNDNIRIREGVVDWEHHKPGYHAVRTNTGCCATDSNWLRYILDEDYDEVGYIAYSDRDGGGHIFNYILMDGWYYIIDLTHYRADWIVTAVESGRMNDYYNSDYVLGNIHKVKDIQNFVSYVQAAFNSPPGLMFMYTAENCLAVDGVHSNGVITITYENTVPVKVIFDDPTDKLEYTFVPAPRNYPDWSRGESFDFSKIH